MDATQQSPAAAAAAADSTKHPTPDDLVPFIHGMRLGDPSSPREQQQPEPQSQPLQVPVPATRLDVMMMMQQLQAGLPYCPQPHNYGVGESSNGAGYVPPYASCSYGGDFYDSHFGKHSPRLNAPAASTPSVTPELDAGAGHFDTIAAPSYPSESRSPSPSPSASASQYQQVVPSAPQLGAACSAWDRNSSLNPSASAFHQTPAWDRNSSLNPSASAFQSSAWDRDSSLNPYAFAAQSSAWDSISSLNPFASAAQSSAWDRDSSLSCPYPSAFQSSLWANPPPRRYLTLEQVHSRLRHKPLESELLMSPEAAAHVVSLLVDGDESARRSVLAGVRLDVHNVMGSNERLGVLLALVRACAGRPDELENIVHALVNSHGYLMGVAKNHNGLEIRVKILKELVGAVTPHPQLLVRVLRWLLRERFMEQCKGAELLEHCFTTLSYENSKIIIHFAITNINELLFSSYGSRCLAECLVYARNGELHALQDIILNRTAEIAMGQYSNYFLQRAIELGSEALQVAIADRVAADVVTLSSDRFGSYVVEACFLLARTPAPLQRLLAAFLSLRDDDLGDMVRGNYSNYVVSKLLDTAKNIYPEPARRLAKKIERLPAGVQREMHARSVMKVVNKLAPKAPMQPRHAY